MTPSGRARHLTASAFLSENTARAGVNDSVRRRYAKNDVEAVMITKRQVLW